MKMEELSAAEKERLSKSALELILTNGSGNADLAKGPKIFAGGEGCYLWDINGNKFLDTFSSLITTFCGHHRPEIKQAILEQMDYLEFFPNYRDSFTIPLIRVAEKLAEIMPGDLDVSFFVNSGSEANETAVKMARQYHWEKGQQHRYKVVARKYAYHGTTLGMSSYTGFTASRKYFEPLLPGALFAPPARCYECDLDLEPSNCNMACLKAMARMVEWEGPETISAIIMDPFPGSNIGFPPPPDGYLKGVRELCDKHGILLIFDEVQTGFGKTGKWFACEHWNVTPDIMTISKAFTGGYLPLGAAVTSKKIAQVFKSAPGKEFKNLSTYGGHTLSCAVALATIGIIERDKLVERAAETGKYLKAELEKLYKYRIVGDVRGMGVLWAVELRADRKSKARIDPKLGVGSFIRDWCWQNGMILRNNAEILVIAPAAVITKEEIDLMIGRLNEVIPLAMKHFNL